MYYFEVKKGHVNNFSYSLFFSGNEKSAAMLARLSHATLALFIGKISLPWTQSPEAILGMLGCTTERIERI